MNVLLRGACPQHDRYFNPFRICAGAPSVRWFGKYALWCPFCMNVMMDEITVVQMEVQSLDDVPTRIIGCDAYYP